MFNLAKKEELINKFLQTVEENVNYTCKDLDLEGFMAGGDADLVRESVQKIQNNVIAAIPEGLPVPKVSLYITPTGEPEINVIVITITNRLTSNKKFKFSYSATRRNTIEKVRDFIAGTYVTLLIDEMVSANLVRVNEVLAQAVKDADLAYEVKVVSDLGYEGKKIAIMSDDEVVFVADDEHALDLADILVLQEVSDVITEEMIQDAFKQVVEDIAGAQTPEQLVELQGGMLVRYVCDISKQVKPMTLIRKVVNRDARKLKGNKDALGYFAEGDIYAIVAKRGGVFEIVLSPFNTKTLRKEEFDVLKALA